MSYTLDRKLWGPQGQFGCCWEEKIILLLPAIKSRFLGRSTSSIITTFTGLVDVVFLCGRVVHKSKNIGGKHKWKSQLWHRISASWRYGKTHFLLLLGAFAKLQKATISLVWSVCPSSRMEHVGRIFMKFHLIIFRKKKTREKSNLIESDTTGASHEDLCTFVKVARRIYLRMRNISMRVVEKIKTRISCNFFCRKSCSLWDNVQKNVVKRDRPQALRWLPKAEQAHSEYVITIPFPLQQWLYERDSLLYYSTLPVLFSNYSTLDEYIKCQSSVLVSISWADRILSGFLHAAVRDETEYVVDILCLLGRASLW